MENYNVENQHATHFLTLTTVGWIDVFTRKRFRDILIESMAFCQKEKGLVINAFVVMSNHIHLIARVKPPFQMSNVLRDFKKYTAAMIIKAIQEEPESRRDWLLLVMEYHAKHNQSNSHHQFWQHDNHAVELYSPEFTYQKLAYIHQNPVQAGWIENAEEYLYSSARNYAGKKGLLEVEIIDIAPTIGYVHLGKL